ncbi:MAG: hypothetical protein QNJ63_28605 [Calothrix sp. MO_192.B10]|nr:hypothetical protein [Calothrix sp. MO_192.B10]
MEAITAIATTITTLIFGEALKEGGKALGKSASDKIAQLVTNIRQRFKESGTEGLLTRAEKQPTESNIAIVEAELITQMNENEAFVSHLKELLQQLEKLGVNRQEMVSGVRANSLEVKGDMTQETSKGGSQVMATDLDIAGDVKIDGNLTQKS